MYVFKPKQAASWDDKITNDSISWEIPLLDIQDIVQDHAHEMYTLPMNLFQNIAENFESDFRFTQYCLSMLDIQDLGIFSLKVMSS